MTELSYEVVLDRCIQLVAKARRIAPEAISSETTFESIGADSLDLINLSFEVEEAFHIEIPDQDLPSVRTIDDLVKGVLVLTNALGSEPARRSA